MVIGVLRTVVDGELMFIKRFSCTWHTYMCELSFRMGEADLIIHRQSRRYRWKQQCIDSMSGSVRFHSI